jgi:hypothetical protein
METIYNILNAYFGSCVYVTEFFLSSPGKVQFWANILALTPFMYLVTVPLWLIAQGDEPRDEGFFMKLFTAVWFATATAGFTWIFRGAGDKTVSGGFLLFGMIFSVVVAFSYAYETGVVAGGVKRANRDLED